MQPKTMLSSEPNDQISKILCKMKNKKSAGYNSQTKFWSVVHPSLKAIFQKP